MLMLVHLIGQDGQEGLFVQERSEKEVVTFPYNTSK